MSLSVVILAYNQPLLTQRCLDSILPQEFEAPLEILLIDNGSIPPLDLPVETARRTENVGNIGGQNRAIEAAKYDLICFVSNDVLMEPDCLRTLYACVTDGRYIPSGFSQVMPAILNPDGSPQCLGMDWRWPGYGISRRGWRGQSYEVPIVPSICYVIRRSVWRIVEGFDEELESSHEDVDFGLRARRKGYSNWIVPGARVRHLGNATLSHTLTDVNGTFHRARQQVLRKHYRGPDRMVRRLLTSLLPWCRSVVRRRSGSTRPGNTGT